MEYGSCNDENCLPPTEVPFTFSGQGAAGAPAAAPAEEKKVEEPANNVSSAVSTADYWTPVVDKLNAFGEETSQTTNQSWFYIFFERSLFYFFSASRFSPNARFNSKLNCLFNHGRAGAGALVNVRTHLAQVSSGAHGLF